MLYGLLILKSQFHLSDNSKSPMKKHKSPKKSASNSTRAKCSPKKLPTTEPSSKPVTVVASDVIKANKSNNNNNNSPSEEVMQTKQKPAPAGSDVDKVLRLAIILSDSLLIGI